MLDITQTLLSVPASGRVTIKVPYVFPSEVMEIQTNVSYAGGTGVAGTATLTFTGAGGVGQNANLSIAGNALTYLGQVGDTTTTVVATNAAAAINANAAVNGYVTATPSTNTVLLTAKTASLSNSGITVTASGTGTLVAASSSAALVSGTNNVVSGTSGITTSFAISYDGVNYVATNVQSQVNAPTAGIVSQTSRLFHTNDPYRADSGNPVSVEVTVTNADATYPAAVSILTEKYA